MIPYLFALGMPILLGVALVPWNIALQYMSNGVFFAIIGAMFLCVGIVHITMFEENTIGLSAYSIGPALLASVLYVGGLWLFNHTISAYVIREPVLTLGVVAAFGAAFPLVTAIAERIYLQRLMTPWQISFMLLVVVGLAGLSLSGKH